MTTPIDKTPNCIKAVLDTPGLYIWLGKISGGHFTVILEITPEKGVHQVSPRTMEKDGILAPDGWTCPPDTGRVLKIEIPKSDPHTETAAQI